MKNSKQKLSVIIVITFLLISCTEVKNESNNSETLETAKKAQEDYRKAWLDGDSSEVMKALSDDIILFPPGKNVQRVQGKDAVKQYWFSKTGDTTYPIKVYKITDQEIYGENEYVFFTGNSYLEFETKIREVVQRRDTSRSEFMSVYKKENGQWKIFRQMWSVK